MIFQSCKYHLVPTSPPILLKKKNQRQETFAREPCRLEQKQGKTVKRTGDGIVEESDLSTGDTSDSDNLLDKKRCSFQRDSLGRDDDEVVRKTSPETAVSLIHRFLFAHLLFSSAFVPPLLPPPLSLPPTIRPTYTFLRFLSLSLLLHWPTSTDANVVHAPKKNISAVAARKDGRARLRSRITHVLHTYITSVKQHASRFTRIMPEGHL